MKRVSAVVTLVACLALVLPALAGEGHPCSASTQDCLNKMATYMKDKGWLGVELEKGETTGAMTVTRVVPGSPAETYGVRVGDELVGVDGHAYAEMSEEGYQAISKTMKPDTEHTFVVKRDGTKHEIRATLASMPEEVLARIVGGHMLEHAKVDLAQN